MSMECRFCNRGFAKSEHLKRHERRHTGSKPFVCQSCNRSFNRQDSLIRHKKLHTRDGSYLTSPILTPESSNGNSTAENDLYGSQHEAFSGVVEPSLTELESPLDIIANFDAQLIWPDTEDLFQSITSTDLLDAATPYLSPSQSDHSGNTKTTRASGRIRAQPASIADIPQGASEQAILDVRQMVSAQSTSIMTAIDTSGTSSVFLDECLHMFFVKFIPTLPLFHRATFVFRDYIHPLLLNAIAIGSLYLGPKGAVSKGEALWKLAHTAVTTSWQSLIAHKGPYDSCSGIQLVLTAVLGQIYGSLSKNKDIRTSSEAFRTLGYFWARQSGLLSKQISFDIPSADASDAERDRKWKIWVAAEVQQRAVLGLYMLDGLVAPISGELNTQTHMSNQLQISCDDSAFLAENSDDWLQTVQRHTTRHTYRSVYRTLFDAWGNPEWQSSALSFFSFRVLLEGMHSVAAVDDSLRIVGLPTKQETCKALARVFEGISDSTSLSESERMELLLKWHSICLGTSANTISLATTICSRYNVSQEIWPAGENVDEYAAASFPNTPHGRRSVLHAIAIQDLVEQLPRGRAHALYMPAALFSAAIVYATFAFGGVASMKIPNNIDWKEICAGQECQEQDMCNYVGGHTSQFDGSQRNLLYDLNSMQKLFRCLATQWGIAFDMEAVIDQLLAKRTQTSNRPRKV